MRYQLSLLFILAFGFFTISGNQTVSAEDTTDTGRVSAIVELTDGELQSLLQTGIFKMEIPPAYVNKVNSLILKRPVRFKDKVAVLFNDVEKRSNTVAISVDDSTIEQISYQPVELKIYESGYSNILVRYQPGNGRKKEKISKSDSVALKVLLSSGKSLTGSLAGLKELEVKSGIGKVKVAFDKVSEISFPSPGNISVLMLNGDSISGDAKLEYVTVISKFGRELIKTKDIASITAPLSSQLSAVQNSAVVAPPAPALPPAPAPIVYPTNQYQYPMESGRIDRLPRSRQQMLRTLPMQMPRQSFPMNSAYGGQSVMASPQPYSYGNGYPVNGGYPVNNSYPVHNSYPANNGYPVNGGHPVNSGMNYNSGSTGQYHIPISEFPIGDSLMRQPLPQIQPSQANENWLFPQN